MLYLLGDYLVKKLLDFDVCIHASFVREFFSGVDPLAFFDSADGVLIGAAPARSKVYLERNLRHMMANDPFVEEENLQGETILYTFHHLERHVAVRILYHASLSGGNVPPTSFPQPDVDVNRLCIKRDGIYVVPTAGFDREPSILYTLMRQCKERTFTLLDPNINPNWKVARAKKMIRKGWRMLNGAVRLAKEDEVPTDDKCSICQSDQFTQPIITRCNHCYCKACWKKYVKSQTSRNSMPVSFIHPTAIPCPYCRHDMDLWEALV